MNSLRNVWLSKMKQCLQSDMPGSKCELPPTSLPRRALPLSDAASAEHRLEQGGGPSSTEARVGVAVAVSARSPDPNLRRPLWICRSYLFPPVSVVKEPVLRVHLLLNIPDSNMAVLTSLLCIQTLVSLPTESYNYLCQTSSF